MTRSIVVLIMIVQLMVSNSIYSQVKVIAHRGAWKNTGVPENSIAALKHAIKMGCAGSEFDIHMSSDSVLFINHNADIQNLVIEKTSSEILSEVKLSNGESLPTLRDYLLAGKGQKKTRLILELKPSVISKGRGIALAHKVLEMVKELKVEALADYISFDYEICLELIRLAPKARVFYLNGDKTPEELSNAGFYGLDYYITALQKNNTWIRDARQKKLAVNVWTVNDEPTMDWLIGKKVEYITTNEPEILLKKTEVKRK